MLKPYLQSIIRIGIALVLVYAGFLLLVFLGQRRMLYIPSKEPMESLLSQARGRGLEPWRNSAGEFIGWKHKTGISGPRALVIHGNAGSAIDRDYYVEGLTSAGIKDAFILEYPGYGGRPGSPSQNSFFAAAADALAALEKEGPVYLVGESIGSGVAAYLAGQHPKAIAGLLLVTPFHNLADVAQFHMPLLPVCWMLRDRFPSAQYLQNYHGPVVFLLAGVDTIIPNKFGRALYDSYSGPKKLWLIPKAGHNDVFFRPADWWREVGDFWRAHEFKSPDTRN